MSTNFKKNAVWTTLSERILRTDNRSLAVAFFKGLWIYSLILWAFIVVFFFVYPADQLDQLSIYIRIPQNLLAVIAFPVSFVSFIIWEYLRKTPKA
jgi:hypothetical protein